MIGYCQVIGNVGVFSILLFFASRAENVWQLAILFVAIGLAQHRLFFPVHDCIHYSLFPSKRENSAWGALISAILGTSFHAIRSQHMEHHRQFGKPEDPGAADYYVRFRTRRDLVAFMIGPLFGSILFKKLGDYFTRPGRTAAEELGTSNRSSVASVAKSYGVILCVQIAACALITRGFEVSALWRYPFFVVLPLVTMFLFLVRLRMFLEHGSLNYDVCDYLEEKRPTARTIYGNWLERILLCGSNFNFHHEHHLYPVVPGCQLPRLHRYLEVQRLKPEDVRSTYIGALLEIWRHLPWSAPVA
jgi:fatty acid desaturase